MEEGGLVCTDYDFGPYPWPLSQLGVGLALPPIRCPWASPVTRMFLLHFDFLLAHGNAHFPLNKASSGLYLGMQLSNTHSCLQQGSSTEHGGFGLC